ncbi:MULTISPECIES: VOC family protein [Micrococcaceae]|uniref:VOC family protein n=1 Tax=Micrococcaceae TaxID=1268 RepID=UPI000CFAFC81|nr:VOC family protein [Arthrobacter sp. MYb222]MCS3491894.1 catechol 2,3-dioxygenase-like lactoylglutathione lyase family enzyme [Arthrobacter sp. JUb119]PQZ87159.1 glyoxalase [Arthrobacter sp. MYb222]
MPRPIRFDHVGITVADLEMVTGFFVSLGLEVEGRANGLEGEFLETVCAVPDSRTNIVMLKAPGSNVGIELSSFERPAHLPGNRAAMANELGLRSIAFELDDLQATVDDLNQHGYPLIGGIGHYEGVWKMAYIRGPEGIIVALAQRLNG